MWLWVISLIIVGGLLYLLHREIYFYEGAHLGTRIQSWLYDSWAKTYDSDKRESQTQDTERLAKPILEALKEVSTPLILDYATGTGRMPATLLREAEFRGRVIAIDISFGMLEHAQRKLETFQNRYELMQLINLPLPFPNDTFDMVSCMEALELMPNMSEPLAELYRVLKPGGILISSRGTEASGRKAKTRNAKEFTQLLNSLGFEQVQITSWWRWFDHVQARKSGQLPSSVVKRSLVDVLHCPKCGNISWIAVAGDLHCQNCAAKVCATVERIFTYSR